MSAALLLAGAGLAAGAGIWLRDRLADERLFFDPFYEAWLRAQTLDALDGRAADNPRRSPIVVCFTTIPSRIPRLETTLKSLLHQSTRPAEIRIHVPEISRREGTAYEVPAAWLSLRTVRVVRCEDYGPATKLLPALADSTPDQPLLIVDDDRIYHPHLVSAFDDWSHRLPDAALCARGWIVPEDLTDRPTTLWSALRKLPPTPLVSTRIRAPARVDIVQGLAGYLVRPRHFHFDEIADYRAAPEAAFYVDDVWISGHCRVPKYLVPIRRGNHPSYRDGLFHKRTSLGLRNRGGGDVEKRSNTIVMRHLRERWLRTSGDAARTDAG
jgi:hypothetical protein